MKKTIIILLTFLLVGCMQLNDIEETDDNNEKPIIETDKEIITVSFNAVGDNLIHGAIYNSPQYIKGDTFDFNAIYSEIKPHIENADISYINQETMLGGTSLGLSHYPMFNSPQEIGDAVANTGFDWINHATNHTLDAYEAGVINTLDYWDKNPAITTTGIARSNDEANELKIIERNGIKFGLLAYTYGTNGIPIPDGKDYLVNIIDKEKMEKDIKRLETEVDSILVSLHWGTEYSFAPNSFQQDIAKFLADLNVDVIIGTHPHVIQPVEYVVGKDGHETLVIYSLGNFLSAQDVNYRMLGAMASWDITFDPNDNSKKIHNVVITPLVNHYDRAHENFKIYRLKDYTNELASNHALKSQYELSYEYFKQLTDDVMGNNIDVVY